MAYTKTYPGGWKNDNTTPITAMSLDNIENGILLSVGGWVTKTISDNGTSVEPSQKVFVDTTGGSFNLILPSTPEVGDTVKFVDVSGNFGISNFTVKVASGDNLMGVTDDFLLLTTNNDYVDITFSGATYGWIITSKP